ncbi:MAG TPA: hypothetical protein PKY70_06010 [Nakamurella multipartita]|nr:hypothetical protein [Nakamurella multipartita]
MIEGAGQPLPGGDRPDRDTLTIGHFAIGLLLCQRLESRLHLGEQPFPPHRPSLANPTRPVKSAINVP